MKRIKNKRGFSIIEVVISLSIISILTGISVYAYGDLKRRSNIDTTAKAVAQQLRYAQVLSQGDKKDKSWGVKLSTGKIVVFAGSNYGNRDTALDRDLELSSTISFSGVTEVVFDKATGLPDVSGNISISSGSDSRTMSINEKGMVSW
ncbi:Tfp pilus assembly protein FimT/FimU [Patescibacteria group bacterium]